MVSKNTRIKKIIIALNILIIFFLVFIVACIILLNRGLNISNSSSSENKIIPGFLYQNQRKTDFYNILVFGSDAVGENTDTILLVSLDAANKKINILHIPRDTLILDSDGKATRKINSAFGEGGQEKLKNEVKKLLGVEIDKHIHITTKGFREVVDEIGGVSLDVPMNMDYEDPEQDLYIHIKKGQQVLDGKSSEGFVRYRYGYVEGDLGRIKAQNIWLSAFIKALLTPSNIAKLPQLVKIAFDNIKTEMTVDELVYLALQASTIGTDKMTFFTLPGEPRESDFGVYKTETIELINKNFNVYNQNIEPSKFNIEEFNRTLTSSQTDYKGTAVS